MSDIDIPGPKPTEDQPTLSELLTEEIRIATDTRDAVQMDAPETVDVTFPHASAQELEVGELPNTFAQLLNATTFAEPVGEEVNWLIAEGALLSVSTRARLLAGVGRALSVRCAEEAVQHAPGTPFTDVPEEFEDLASELRDILSAITNRKIQPSNFAPTRVVELVHGAAIDPVMAFAVCQRSIRVAQEAGPRRVGILGRHADNDWEDRLRELRQMLLGAPDSSLASQL